MTNNRVKLVKVAIALGSVTILVTILGEVYQVAGAETFATRAQAGRNLTTAPAAPGPTDAGDGTIWRRRDQNGEALPREGTSQFGGQGEGQGLFAPPGSGFSGRTRTRHS